MGKRLGIGFVLVAALLVVADRGGQIAIERVVAGELQDKLRSPAQPKVDIAGIPFLPQLITRNFDDVTMSVRDADAGGVRVARIDAHLRGVTQADGGARVEDVDGNGLIKYDALTEAAKPLRVSYGGDGLLQVTAGADVLQASASGRPKIVGDELVIKPERVSTTLTETKNFDNVPTIKMKLRDLPPNLEIDIIPAEGGIEFSFEGRNVLFTAKDLASSMPFSWGPFSWGPVSLWAPARPAA